MTAQDENPGEWSNLRLRIALNHVAPTNEKVVVVVHGIFSAHDTFVDLIGQLRANLMGAGQRLRVYYFDYNFHRSIVRNGQLLSVMLRHHFRDGALDVTLIGHSMGGLVARAALLHAKCSPAVRRLVMLGTPNHGTLHTARLGTLIHVARESAGVLWTIFARKSPGIRQLSEIGRTLDPLVESGSLNTQAVDYVTIAGLRYHDENGWMSPGSGFSTGLWALNVLLRLTRPFGPKLRLPHDGIVEAVCVQLSSLPSYFSERPLGAQRRRYCHLTHPDYKHADHLCVHTISRTASVIADLIVAADLVTWQQQVSADGVTNIVN